jgi:predicted ester cyclase
LVLREEFFHHIKPNNMNKLLLSAIVALSMTACEQKAEDVSSSTGSDSTAVASSSGEDQEERNKETALASVRAVGSGNVESGFAHVATDAVDYGDGSGPTVKNKDSIIAGIKVFIASFPDHKGENFEAVSDGDKVYVSGDWSGTFKKDYMGMKATGKAFKVKDVDIFTFNDKGEIVDHRSVQSWATLMSQVGAKPPKK